jgi:sulfatase maturation enzyme AslB (radical SAM superfamily)
MTIDSEPTCAAPDLQWKLWIYTNYDCNPRCSYCVAKSSPNAPRRAIGLASVRSATELLLALRAPWASDEPRHAWWSGEKQARGGMLQASAL